MFSMQGEGTSTTTLVPYANGLFAHREDGLPRAGVKGAGTNGLVLVRLNLDSMVAS